MNSSAIPCALTIAGSDSGGGAGIQADLRTFTAMGTFGTSAITALTSQNPLEVRGVFPVAEEFVISQIEAVIETMNIRAAKSGMLFSSGIIEAVAQVLSKRDFKLVCDPVMVSTSGMKLLKDDALDAMRNIMLPLADVITPNIPEAELITRRTIKSRLSALDAACMMAERFKAAVILKGGHAENASRASDVVVTENETFVIRCPRLKLGSCAGHGTGCTLSAACAAALANGKSLKDAIIEAKAFVTASLANAVETGNRKGKIFSMYPVPDFKRYIAEMEIVPL